MAEFTCSELEILHSNGVDPEDVLDVRGFRPCEWKPDAKANNAEIVLREKCCKCGQRLFTRNNSCLECNPSALMHQRRRSQPGYIYGAYSPSSGLVKIGHTQDYRKRMTVLRCGYAGEDDWEYFGYAWVRNRGRSEDAVFASIGLPRLNIDYIHSDGKTQGAKEILEIKPSKAWWHLVRVANKDGGNVVWKHANLNALGT